MPNVLLHVGNDLPGIGLVPTAVQLLRDGPKLNNKVARKVYRLGLAAFFAS
jgi:hypothetical protein